MRLYTLYPVHADSQLLGHCLGLGCHGAVAHVADPGKHDNRTIFIHLSITPVVPEHAITLRFPWVAAAIPSNPVPALLPPQFFLLLHRLPPSRTAPSPFSRSQWVLRFHASARSSGQTHPVQPGFNCMSMMLICKSLAILFIWHCWAKNSWGSQSPSWRLQWECWYKPEWP